MGVNYKPITFILALYTPFLTGNSLASIDVLIIDKESGVSTILDTKIHSNCYWLNLSFENKESTT
jgi:hypothetical protein